MDGLDAIGDNGGHGRIEMAMLHPRRGGKRPPCRNCDAPLHRTLLRTLRTAADTHRRSIVQPPARLRFRHREFR